MKISPLKLRRINLGINSLQAAQAMKISKSTFYKLEGGHTSPSAKLIARIAKTYRCSIDEIYKDLNIIG
ncbi:MAG: helix-turn-helix domain-containing protein [Sarcina sp.]